jgi:hypothetical protein
VTSAESSLTSLTRPATSERNAFSDSVSACSGEGRRFFGMTETNLICAQGGILDPSPTAHIARLCTGLTERPRKGRHQMCPGYASSSTSGAWCAARCRP